MAITRVGTIKEGPLPEMMQAPVGIPTAVQVEPTGKRKPLEPVSRFFYDEEEDKPNYVAWGLAVLIIAAIGIGIWYWYKKSK